MRAVVEWETESWRFVEDGAFARCFCTPPLRARVRVFVVVVVVAPALAVARSSFIRRLSRSCCSLENLVSLPCVAGMNSSSPEEDDIFGSMLILDFSSVSPILLVFYVTSVLIVQSRLYVNRVREVRVWEDNAARKRAEVSILGVLPSELHGKASTRVH